MMRRVFFVTTSLALVVLVAPVLTSAPAAVTPRVALAGGDAGHPSPVAVAQPRDPSPVVPDLAVRQATARPSPEQTCVASFYGDELAGAITASGVPFDPAQLTAAMWDVPFGTEVLVTDPASGRAVVVAITDRGPAHRLGRCIDLSEAAMSVLGGLDVGLVDVVLHIPTADEEHHHGDGHRTSTHR